ncbi:MAG: type I-E CRISPR-associated protein Cse1/CasA [Leptospirillia bacterium]
MGRFNLIDEAWIPVRFPDGARAELGIRDTLLRAREIAAIEDPSPLVVAALHRFLLAVLYRALEGPTDIDEARALFRDGLPGEKVTAYLETWWERFWLFDDEYPFYQVPGYTPGEWRAWPALAAEHNADNAKVLFDHVEIASAGDVSPATASRWLIACQTFVLGGGNSEFKYTKGGPSAAAAMVLPLGRDLMDTLLFSLVHQNRMVAAADLPLWEREPESIETLKSGPARRPDGHADRYTWRTRTIRLEPSARGVERLGFASGVGCDADDQSDPMVAYRVDEKRGRLPVQFRERGLWRDFDSLLPDGGRDAPGVIEHARDLARHSPRRFPHAVMVLGQANNQAKVEFWRMERFALPGALAGAANVRGEIRELLSDAEDAQKSLWAACRSFARDLLSRGERAPDRKDVTAFVAQMPASPWYWSTLEARFHGILREFTRDRDPDDIRLAWLVAVRDALREAWNRHAASVAGGDAWAIRAVVRAEEPVRRKLKELGDEIARHQPGEEDP